MLFVVANQVMQRKAIVRGHEIDAGVRFTTAVLVQVAASTQSRCELRNGISAIPAPKLPDRIAILAVPLGPQHGEITYLISALTQIPGFGNQLDLRQHRVLVNDVEERSQAIDFVQLSCQARWQDRSEIRPRASLDPVSQTVHD